MTTLRLIVIAGLLAAGSDGWAQAPGSASAAARGSASAAAPGSASAAARGSASAAAPGSASAAASIRPSGRSVGGKVQAPPATPALLAKDDGDDDWGEDAPAKKAQAKGRKNDEWSDERAPKLELHGFVEFASATRLRDDPSTEDQLILSEARFRLEALHAAERFSLSFKGDFLADGVSRAVSVDIREAVVALRLFSFLDVKAGRQVLTWGTGDLLFLNDLFPKDWVSFIGGRADEYLKAPSTAVKLAFYSPVINLDLVWTPIFEADRYITGERLSLFNPMAGQLVGGGKVIRPPPIDQKLKYGELHARLHRTFGGVELALYGYHGFFKQPLSGTVVAAGPPPEIAPAHSRLAVYGASVRGSLLGGIYNIEGAFYRSLDDNHGTNPLVPNHQLRAVVGYEHELVSKMSLGLQYYNEWTLQYDQLQANSAARELDPKELRHVLTLRWMYRLLRDDLVLGLFAFYSPNEKDFFLRPQLSYKFSDALKIDLGANVLWGDTEHTFFGMLQWNTNVYARARYTF